MSAGCMHVLRSASTWHRPQQAAGHHQAWQQQHAQGALCSRTYAFSCKQDSLVVCLCLQGKLGASQPGLVTIRVSAAELHTPTRSDASAMSTSRSATASRRAPTALPSKLSMECFEGACHASPPACTPCQHLLPVRCAVGRVIGVGSFGRVRIARAHATGTLYVIKTLGKVR